MKTELREREQLETAAKKVQNDKYTFFTNKSRDMRMPKRNDNRIQHRSTDKSYGTKGRQ